MSLQRRSARFALCASLAVAPLLLAGCSSDGTVQSSSPQPTLVSGNWQISSSAAVAGRLPALSGALSAPSGSSEAITGVLHSQSASACIAPPTSLAVSGATGQTGDVTLSGPLAGGTLTINGMLAADGKSLSDVSYSVSGGTCAFPKPASGTAQLFAPVIGAYAGDFTDTDGVVANVNASLSQSSDPTGDGNYTLTGSATVSDNPCFSGAVPVSNTRVTGGTFVFTFTDPLLGGSVTANGTFAADATTLTVTQWTSSGTCGADSGIGSMAQQPAV